MKFQYCVIGIRDSAQDLIRVFEQHGRDVISSGIDGNMIESISKIQDSKVTKIFLNRKMSPGEIGCALSHQTGYELASPDTDWLIVIEDDVRLTGRIEDFESYLEQVAINTGIVVSDRFDNDLPVNTILPSSIRPYRTHLYAMNKLALKAATQRQSKVLTTADWPIQWCFLVDFIVLDQNTFTLIEESSLISAERLPLQLKRNEKFKTRLYLENIFPLKVLRLNNFLKFIPRYFLLKFEKLPHSSKSAWCSVSSNLF